MKSSSSNLSFHLITGLLILVFLTISPASAALNIEGSKLMQELTPGQTISFPMTLSVGSADTPTDIEISVLGFGNGPDGRYLGLDPVLDTSQYSARPMITLDKKTVHYQLLHLMLALIQCRLFSPLFQ